MANLSTLGALLRENVSGDVRDLVHREADLITAISQLGGRMIASTGSAPFKWNIVTAGNSSAAVFVEGQAPGVPGAQTYQKPSLDVTAVEANWTMTGHAADNAAKGGYYADAPGYEEMLTRTDLLKKVEDVLCGNVPDQGIASIIDANDTYAGIAPGSVAQWASYEVDASGALTVSLIDDMYENLTSGIVSGISRGASPNAILTSVKQVKKYSQLVGTAGAANNSVRFMPDGSRGVDLAFRWNAATYQGIPFRIIRALSNAELYMTDMTDYTLIEHRAPRVDQVSSNPELIQYRISTSFALKIEKRSQHGKLRGLT